MSSTEVHPVIVVGGGPAGMTASILLSRAGVEHVLVEREKLPTASPRAHVINQRTMEIFREIGVAEAVREAAAPDRRTGLSVWCTSLAGRELGRRWGWGHGDDERADEYRAASPCAVTDLGQHRLEPILRAEAARHSEAELRFGHEMSSFTQDDHGVAIRTRSLTESAEQELRAGYLFAADGSGSSIQRGLGITMQGEADVEEVASTYFRADLRPHIDGELALLYWLVSPGREEYIDGGVFICHGPDEWLYAVARPLEAARHEPDDSAIVSTLRRATGVPDLDPDIRDHSHWVIHGQVAERYAAGRIFLTGDAAHRFPQAGGRGLNTAVQDSHNLVWKLAAVLSGRGGPGLLESYSVERRPVGLVNARDSLANMRRMAEVSEALASERGQTPADALAVLGADTDSGERRRLAVAQAVADQDPQFDALGAELGFHYDSGAVVPDGSPPPAIEDPVREYVPTTRPGHRLPHAWLRLDGRRVSSLDLVADRLTLMLDAPGCDWARAAATIGDELIHPLTISPGGAVEPEDERWPVLREVGPAGAVLVRPDGHVAWRSHGGVDNPASALRSAVATIMDREPR